jgi:hypothetical protein
LGRGEAATATSWLERPLVLFGVLWIGVGVLGAATWAMSFAQQSVPPVTAMLCYVLTPCFAAIYAAALLGEFLSPPQLLGGALVISTPARPAPLILARAAFARAAFARAKRRRHKRRPKTAAASTNTPGNLRDRTRCWSEPPRGA